MTSILSLIVVLGVIIFVHELGHFLAAKLVGIRVEVFSLGFPPKMIGKKIGETEYILSWIPIGGYVKMAGMVDESLDNKPLTGAPWEFMSKNFFQKALTISGGVLMNVLLAFFLYTGIAYFSGVGDIGPAKIGSVEEGFPADSAGILPGDVIVKIQGDTILGWKEMSDKIHAHPDAMLNIVWRRGDSLMSADVRTVSREVIDSGKTIPIGLIGISPELEMRPVGIWEAITTGAQSTFFIAAATIIGLEMLIKGEAGLKDFVGPVGIARYSGESARSGFAIFLGFIALISVNIGLLNILPFPALDGGHLVLIAIESVIRRPISTKIKLIIQQIGMALLLLLILIISYNDILRLITG
jgi:regulator of sigma E protease